jgi:hypothetical protein
MAIALPKITKYTLITILVLGVGSGLGGLVALELRAHQAAVLEAQRKAEQGTQTALVLDKMQTIQVGDTLRDFTFADLSGQPIRLSEHVTGLTWIAIIEPSCETCVLNVRRIKSVLPDSLATHRVVFISGSNPRDMQDLRNSVGIGSLFLYDHKRQWSNGYKFNAFPFHMLVDRGLQIREIVIGDLSEDQIKRVF